MTRYQLDIFLICLEIIYVCSGSSNSTNKPWYLFMDCDTNACNEEEKCLAQYSVPALDNMPLGKRRICTGQLHPEATHLINSWTSDHVHVLIVLFAAHFVSISLFLPSANSRLLHVKHCNNNCHQLQKDIV